MTVGSVRATRAPRRPEFGTGMLLARTFGVWFGRLPAFLVITVIVFAPLGLYTWWLIRAASEGEQPTTELGVHVQAAVQEMLGHVCGAVAAGAFAFGVFHSLQKQRVGLMRCVSLGLARLPAVLGVALVTGLIVGLLSVPSKLVSDKGIVLQLLLLLPAIWVQVILCTAVPAAVIERTGVGDSLARSAKLTQGHRLSIFLAWLSIVVLFVVLLVPIVLRMMRPGLTGMEPFDADAFQSRVMLMVWVTVGLVVCMTSLQAVGHCVAYHGLRSKKEGVTAAELVKAFE
jgi:hypothetical protein